MSVNYDALKNIIAKHIQISDGFLPFDSFMQLALYQPELGYYESQHVFGEKGDFITGIDLGPWLGLGFDDLMQWGWEQLGRPCRWVLLEQGGGSGHLLTQVIQHLQERNISMPDIIAVERSAYMRERQREHYQQQGIDVQQYAELGDIDIDAALPVLMMCNELPDAFPVKSFVYHDKKYYERGVVLKEGELCWQRAEEPMQNPPHISADLMATWPDGYISEYNPALNDWQKAVANIIGQGFLFCVDYGYSQQEYYRSNRMEGTLMGHRDHQVVEDVLSVVPGSCDMTAHIDFTALANIGQKYDLQPTTFITQGGWLAQSPGVQTLITALAAEGSVASMQAMAQAKRMLLPMGMGESFKLLIQCKNGCDAPDYLKPLDRMRDLHLAKAMVGE